MNHKLRIDSVAIIESLPATEQKTGESLAEHLRAEGHEAVYLRVEKEVEFTRAIQEVERMSRSLGKRVALHFEVHGNEHGFGLASGELVNWSRVKQDIINLNFALKNHLLVSMAVCEGMWLLSIMRATDTSPFHSLISSQGTIYQRDIEKGFPVFYKALFAGLSLEEATQKLNVEAIRYGSEFQLTTSEETFAKVFEKYFREWCTPEAMYGRGNALCDFIASKGLYPGMPREKILDLYKQYFSSHEEPSFVEYRAKFFMHDVYPENMAEFCPTYEEVRGAK